MGIFDILHSRNVWNILKFFILLLGDIVNSVTVSQEGAECQKTVSQSSLPSLASFHTVETTNMLVKLPEFYIFGIKPIANGLK